MKSLIKFFQSLRKYRVKFIFSIKIWKMATVRESLKSFINTTETTPKYNWNTLLNGESISETYKSSDELHSDEYFLNRKDKNHVVRINNIEYSASDSDAIGLINDGQFRTRIIKLNILHTACLDNFINYVESIDRDNDESETTRKYIDDFLHYYKLLRKINNTTIRDEYQNYWKYIIRNIINKDVPISSKPNAICIIKSDLEKTLEKL